ncbi:hypothetical protein PENSUB_11796 [Penicillium subrubescens]|uniref:Uncharacterized protein n=1 Tax=Penicillium subrubescens TaxID=1316194 RepID=A0A1Q5T2S3_9EURO|nr:hypothetical protein PENSUB_11796 [Penicillium subrubescens]
MTLPARPTEFDARFLYFRMVGTKVTTFCDFNLQQPSAVSPSASAISLSVVPPSGVSPPAVSPPGVSPPVSTDSFAAAPTNVSLSGSAPLGISRSWIITERLSEEAVYLTQEDADDGCGSPMTVGKFLCHLEEDPTQIAFMRVYYQIPITGTEHAPPATRTQQVQPDEVCGEIEAFKLLMSQGCCSVPRLLGYCEKKQGEHDLVPGGYVKYIVWEKVPGEPLTEDFFWSLDPHKRKDIRAKFRDAFDRISGFRRGWPIRDKLPWSDTHYVAYMLANPPDKSDWPTRPGEWEL